MTAMAERRNRMERLVEIMKNGDLSQALDEVYRHPEMGIDLLPVLVEEPSRVKLEHSIRIIEIAIDIVDANPGVALTAIGSQLNAFGKYVQDTRIMGGQGVGVDVAREERLEKANAFTAAWVRAQLKFQELIVGNAPAGKQASSLIAEWSHLQ
jgi:hypothetical protein